MSKILDAPKDITTGKDKLINPTPRDGGIAHDSLPVKTTVDSFLGLSDGVSVNYPFSELSNIINERISASKAQDIYVFFLNNFSDFANRAGYDLSFMFKSYHNSANNITGTVPVIEEGGLRITQPSNRIVYFEVISGIIATRLLWGQAWFLSTSGGGANMSINFFLNSELMEDSYYEQSVASERNSSSFRKQFSTMPKSLEAGNNFSLNFTDNCGYRFAWWAMKSFSELTDSEIQQMVNNYNLING